LEERNLASGTVDPFGMRRHPQAVARRARLNLFGEGWIAYGCATIPDDRVIEVSEAEVASFLRHRGSSRRVEFVEWVPDAHDPHGEESCRE
jgi:hypothetical protein